MKKLLTLAACAALLTGCDFVGGDDGNPVAIASLTIEAAPLPSDSDGSAPDLYVEIQDVGGRAIYQAPSVAQNLDSLPYVIDTDGELTGTTRSYFVVLMDQEADGSYRLISISESFTAEDLRASSESTYAVRSSDGALQASIALSASE